MGKKTNTSKANRKAYLITTSKRGVFFGYSLKKTDSFYTLKDARMVVYWSSDVRGVLGLVADGPNESCRITPKVGTLKLPVCDVDSISDVSIKAAIEFEKGYWG
jgi:hypothetical protein